MLQANIIAHCCARLRDLILPFAAPRSNSSCRIATEGTNPPFRSINSSGEFEGFDIESPERCATK